MRERMRSSLNYNGFESVLPRNKVQNCLDWVSITFRKCKYFVFILWTWEAKRIKCPKEGVTRVS